LEKGDAFLFGGEVRILLLQYYHKPPGALPFKAHAAAAHAVRYILLALGTQLVESSS
jgi:hypothetical protein